MPELPEVETIAENLRNGAAGFPSILGFTITAAEILWQRTLVLPDAAEFERRVTGQKINNIGRRGKFLLLTLSGDTLLVHLRMSGDLLLESTDTPVGTHYRCMFDLDHRLRLSFNDPRKFGRIWLTSQPSLVLGSLGPEPLDDQFTAQDLHQGLTTHRRQLKPLLLDQSFLAGLGNIYTDEALHQARLHPLMNSAALTYSQADTLLRAIRVVLREAIRRNGASIDWVYRGGDFQNYFNVYQRTGEPCYTCGTPIQRILVGQRGTHFCPNCQPV